MISHEVIRRYNAPSRKGACNAEGYRIVRSGGDNALCGDSVSVELAIEGSGCAARIVQARFEGFGCALCVASADACAELIEGEQVSRASEVGVAGVCALLGGISVDRSRRECVELPIRAFKTALGQVGE